MRTAFDTSRSTFASVVDRSRRGFLGACLERAVAMEAISRSIVLASKGFTAGIPLIIVASALAPGNRDFAAHLIHRFQLHGSTADQVRLLFNTSSDVRGAVTWVSVLFLIASAMSFARSLQSMYERTLNLAYVGLRARWRGAVWVLGACVYFGVLAQLKPNISAGGTNILRAVVSVVPSFAFWLWTPRILLGPRIPWRRFVPIAALTTIAVTIFEVATPLYMPQIIRDDAARYGTIGAAFALLSWLVILAFLIVGSAVVASQIDREREQPEAYGPR